jgi:predicted phosphodiesterase
MGIADPTSPAKNYKELIKVERRTKKWISENNNLITIVGHTHRPRFPEPGDIAFFNDGSCVHPRSITGIEIVNGTISLIKWQIATKEDGTLQIVRVLLEGPINISDYKTD